MGIVAKPHRILVHESMLHFSSSLLASTCHVRVTVTTLSSLPFSTSYSSLQLFFEDEAVDRGIESLVPLPELLLEEPMVERAFS